MKLSRDKLKSSGIIQSGLFQCSTERRNNDDMNSLTLTYSLADQSFSLTKSVGIFNVSTQLLENLARHVSFERLTVLTNSTLDDKLQLPSRVTVQHCGRAVGSKLGRIFWDQWGVYEAAKNSGNRWLFLPKGFASFSRLPSLKLAAYVYDAAHDFYRYNYPGVMPWVECKYFTRCLRATLKYSSVIFTDSDFAREELRRLARRFEIEPPPMVIAGIGFTCAEKKCATKRDSLLFLTSAWPHKLTERGVDFIERWQREAGFSGGVELVGSLPAGVHLPRHAGWRHHPRLSEATYRQFLAEAKALLFFSAYEGFGMPPVEAMIAGTCPVFSDLPVTREVMGGMGFSFSNDSYESFARSMNKALSVSETQIQLWAEQLLERHCWDDVVEKIINGIAQADNCKEYKR